MGQNIACIEQAELPLITDSDGLAYKQEAAEGRPQHGNVYDWFWIEEHGTYDFLIT